MQKLYRDPDFFNVKKTTNGKNVEDCTDSEFASEEKFDTGSDNNGDDGDSRGENQLLIAAGFRNAKSNKQNLKQGSEGLSSDLV